MPVFAREEEIGGFVGYCSIIYHDEEGTTKQKKWARAKLAKAEPGSTIFRGDWL